MRTAISQRRLLRGLYSPRALFFNPGLFLVPGLVFTKGKLMMMAEPFYRKVDLKQANAFATRA